MTDTAFTHEDRKMVREIYDVIVGTIDKDGLRVVVGKIREDLDDHTNWNHEDAKEIATTAASTAATAAVLVHEQQRPHVTSRRSASPAGRFVFQAGTQLLAIVGAAVFLSILGVLWLGVKVELVRQVTP